MAKRLRDVAVGRGQRSVPDMDNDSSQFIKLICGDGELDFCLDRLLVLFALGPPAMYGTYRHHASGNPDFGMGLPGFAVTWRHRD